jgi:hypothetical protein
MLGLPVASVLLIAANDRTAVSAAPSAEDDEDKVWKMEHSYWEYVKALDVNGYKGLWHEDFVGWPSTKAMPLRKDHIADWLEDDRAEQNLLHCCKLEACRDYGFGQRGRCSRSPDRTLG